MAEQFKADQFTSIIRGLGRRGKRYGAAFARKTAKRATAALGQAGRASPWTPNPTDLGQLSPRQRMTPEQQAELGEMEGLSQGLRALTAGMGTRARAGRFTPPALLNMAQSPVAAASALTEDPVRAQQHLPPGRYSRPLGTLGIGAGAALREQQATEAANTRLGEAMRANRPLATGQQPVRSNITGANLGRFSERFQGSLGEYTQANIDYRDALARGEEAVRPGSFQGGPESPSDPLAASMAQQEEVAAGRREARRDEFAGSFVPKEIRQRLVTAKKQGRRITPVQAMVERNMELGKPIAPEGLMALFGELGQKEAEGRRGAETAAAERETAVEANRQQILGIIMGAEGISPSAKRTAMAELIRGGGVGGDLAASGGGLGAPTLPGMDRGRGPVSDILMDVPQEIIDDPSETEKWMKRQGLSQSEIEREGLGYFGRPRWKGRNFPFRNFPGVKQGVDIGIALEEGFPGISQRFAAPFLRSKRAPPKPPRKLPKPSRKRKPPTGPSASFPYPG